jgi:hypothetical protein
MVRQVQRRNKLGALIALVTAAALLLAGLFLLLAIVAGFLPTRLWLALLAFAATLAGMGVGLLTLARQLRPPRIRYSQVWHGADRTR